MPIYEDALVAFIKERLGVKELAVVIMNFEGHKIDEYDEMVRTLAGSGSYTFAPKKLYPDLKNRVTPIV